MKCFLRAQAGRPAGGAGALSLPGVGFGPTDGTVEVLCGRLPGTLDAQKGLIACQCADCAAAGALRGPAVGPCRETVVFAQMFFTLLIT